MELNKHLNDIKLVNIISRTNGVGLDRDTNIIRDLLEKLNIKVTFSHCRSRNFLQSYFTKKPIYDINIFIERIFPSWINLAKNNFLIPNQERFPLRHKKRLKKIDEVLCKTKHAENIFSEIGSKTHLIGFSSENLNINQVTTDYSRFLHIAGKSTLKGTSIIIDLWRKNPNWPTLTLIQTKKNLDKNIPDNVTIISDYISNEQIKNIYNTHGVHLCTSLSEGWGHYIVEAMSCAALIVTTDAPPMNELINLHRGILIPYNKMEKKHLGFNYYVNSNLLENNINKIINMESKVKESFGKKAQEWYEKNKLEFETTFTSRILKEF